MELDKLLVLHDSLRATINSVDEEIVKTDWKLLVSRGYRLLAMRACCIQENCSLSEAKGSIDILLNLHS